MARVLGYGGLANTRARSFAGKATAAAAPVLRGFNQPDILKRPRRTRRRFAAMQSVVYPSFAEALKVAQPFIQADTRHKARKTRRKIAVRESRVYSIPRDRSVLIDPLVIEFTVNDPSIRRPGGWIAGSDMVRPVIGHRRVRTIG